MTTKLKKIKKLLLNVLVFFVIVFVIGIFGSLVFNNLYGELFFIVGVFFSIPLFSLFLLNKSHEDSDKSENIYADFLSRKDNYEILGYISPSIYKEENILKYFPKKEKTILLRNIEYKQEYNQQLKEEYILLTKDKHNHITHKYISTVTYYDLSHDKSLIDFYDHLIKTEIDFKIYHQAELNQKIEFLIKNRDIFNNNYLDIENSDKLRKTYIDFKMDIFNNILNYIDEKHKISDSVIKKEKNIIHLKMKKRVDSELTRADYVKMGD